MKTSTYKRHFPNAHQKSFQLECTPKGKKMPHLFFPFKMISPQMVVSNHHSLLDSFTLNDQEMRLRFCLQRIEVNFLTQGLENELKLNIYCRGGSRTYLAYSESQGCKRGHQPYIFTRIFEKKLWNYRTFDPSGISRNFSVIIRHYIKTKRCPQFKMSLALTTF